MIPVEAKVPHVSSPDVVGCKGAADTTSIPVKVGASSGVTVFDLIPRNSHATIQEATTPWTALFETIRFATLINF